MDQLESANIIFIINLIIYSYIYEFIKKVNMNFGTDHLERMILASKEVEFSLNLSISSIKRDISHS